MALTSPGVQVTVIDESFYTPAEPGTVPLIVVATAQNKINASGTDTAAATTQANAGNAFKVTSQRDLVDLFGIPFFEQTASSTPIHGSERNEYGLLAAYSLLGVSNAAFIVRADVDLDQLQAEVNAPGAFPLNGKWWIDTRATTFGIQEWNNQAASTVGGQRFTNKAPLVLTDADNPAKIANGAPKTSVGKIGDYAVVFETVGENGNYATAKDLARIYLKSPGNGGIAGGGTAVQSGQWVLVGSNSWAASWPTVAGGTSFAPGATVPNGNFTINGTTITVSGTPTLSALIVTINSLNIAGVTAANVSSKLYLYSNAATETVGDSSLSSAITVASGTLNVSTVFGITAGTFHGPRLVQQPHTSVPAFKIGDLDDEDGNVVTPVQTFVVTAVPNPAGAGAIYQIDGVNRPVLTLVRGGIYTFDQSAASNNNHPIAFRDAAGNSFTAGVVSSGTPGTIGAKTVFTVPLNAPNDLRYYCVTHGNGMGNTISVIGSGKVGSILANGRPTGSVWIKTTEPNFGARWRAKRWNTATLSWVSFEAPIFASTNAALFFLDRSGGGTNISEDSLFVQSNATEHSAYDATPSTAEFRVWYRHVASGQGTSVTSNLIKAGTFASTQSFSLAESLVGGLALDAARSISITAVGTSEDADLFAAAINAAGFVNIEASVIAVTTSQSRLVITHNDGGDFRLIDGTGTPVADLFTPYNLKTRAGTENFYNISAGAFAPGQEELAPGAAQDYLASGWQPLAAGDIRFAASPDAPLNEAADGQLWYNPSFADVDIMVHNGNTFVGYRFGGAGTTPAPYFESPTTPLRKGYLPIVSASNPYELGVTLPGDLWISTADLENFPTIYRYDNNLVDIGDPAQRWQLIDKSDQTTEEGVVFADARWNTTGTGKLAGTLEDLVTSNFLDTDAPDPALFPKGILLYNLRRSGGNVKRYRNNYLDIATDNARTSTATLTTGAAFVSGAGLAMTNYEPDRWVTASGNQEDGSGTFGRLAQRKVIVQAIKSVIDTSQEIRDEERRNFNIIACPGYPEAMSNLVNLNIDRGITAFVIGDTPLRLRADATTLTNWGTNAALVTDNNDEGIVTYDEFLATFYPNGFTTDLSGANAVVPASHMMLKTIALSDNVSFPWFAPAGTRRGGITNATAVGFIDAATGEFQTVALNEGQRDTLYDLKVNPIPFFNGVGLVAYGQRTRARNASALDRINVARLVVYLRSQLNKLARPFLFEPNDKITRDEIKQATESLLLELVGLRAIYDFAVVCDESNNTPSRIDRNELYLDIAIEPVKAIEFIYIPLRIKNTGEI